MRSTQAGKEGVLVELKQYQSTDSHTFVLATRGWRARQAEETAGSSSWRSRPAATHVAIILILLGIDAITFSQPVLYNSLVYSRAKRWNASINSTSAQV
eukprot:352970-Chlamydomonas_euryale.AAC.1